jgi:hypothetical protein
MNRFTLTAVLSVVLCTAAPVAAQTSSLSTTGAAVTVFTGGASASSGTDPIAGASIGWELTRSVAVEAQGLWIDSRQMNVYAAYAGARVTLPLRSNLAPFVAAGAGVQTAIVDPNGPGIPSFYQRRMTIDTHASGSQPDQRFDDPVVVLGGGFDYFVSRHVAFRPDFRVLLASGGGHTRTTTVLAVHVAYHFDDHTGRR